METKVLAMWIRNTERKLHTPFVVEMWLDIKYITADLSFPKARSPDRTFRSSLSVHGTVQIQIVNLLRRIRRQLTFLVELPARNLDDRPFIDVSRMQYIQQATNAHQADEDDTSPVEVERGDVHTVWPEAPKERPN